MSGKVPFHIRKKKALMHKGSGGGKGKGGKAAKQGYRFPLPLSPLCFY
jgi:hypothetical protein